MKAFELVGTVVDFRVDPVNVSGRMNQPLLVDAATLRIEPDSPGARSVTCRVQLDYSHKRPTPPSALTQLRGRRVSIRGRQERLHPFTWAKAYHVTEICDLDGQTEYPVSGTLDRIP